MPQNDSTLPFRLSAKRLDLLICAVLALLTLITFRSVLSNEFIKFDDRQYVTDNTHVTSGLTWRNLKWAFTTGYASNWHPLTWLSHMLDVQLFGLKAGGHHLTNLVLHVANTLVLFLVLARMSRAIWSAAFVAALFGVHPLHVESVAWVAERKDVLSTLFFFLTLGAYALYAAETHPGQTDSPPEEAPSESAHSSEEEKRRPQRVRWRRFAFYILSLVLFAMGLLSKAMLVTTPFVLLLLDWWPLKRVGTGKANRALWLGLVLEKIPFLCLTVLSCVVTFRAQAGSHSVTTGLPFGLRAENAIVSYVKYIGKSVWPADLAIFYPHPNTRYGLRELAAGCPSSEQWPMGPIAATALLLVTISFLAVLEARRHPWLFTGWFWYVGTLVPVIGIVQIGMQGMADRYTYVPLVGLFLCLAWGAAELLQPRRFGKPLLWGGGLLAVACCATAAHQQALHWRTNWSVFEQALKATRHNAIAECNVGEEFAQAGKLDLAQEHFRSALKADPRNPLACLDLGMSLELQGKPEQALEQFETTVRLRPWSETARRHLAGVLKSLGRRDEALVQYEEVLKLNPGDAIVHYEVGTILATQAKMNEALVHLSRAVQLKPDYVEALVGLGTLLASQGKFNEARQPLQQATLLRPNNAELRLELGKTLLLAGKNAEATAEFAQVVRLDPELPDKLLQEGKSLAARGELSTALARCNTALWLRPESPGALSEVAWLLATHSVPRLRNGARALRLAQKAVDLTGGSELRSLASLDAAYAETGRFSEAINAVQKTHTLAVSAGDKEAAQACETRLALYRNLQPFHQ